MVTQTSLGVRHWVFIEVIYSMCVECACTTYNAMNLHATAVVATRYSLQSPNNSNRTLF